jgi:hypothetical protein
LKKSIGVTKGYDFAIPEDVDFDFDFEFLEIGLHFLYRTI